MRRLLLIVFLSVSSVFANNDVDEKTADTLAKLWEVIVDTRSELAEIRKPAAVALSEEETASNEKREAELAARLAGLKKQFDELASGIREEDLQTADEAKLDLKEEFQDVLRPLVKELKKATERPRETEELREREQRLVDQAELAEEALARLSRWGELNGGAGKEIEKLQDLWKARQKDAQGQLAALAVQMEQQNSERGPLLEPVSDAFGKFFKGRGLSLIKAVAALIFTWVALRWLWRMTCRLPLIRRQDHGAFGWRLVELTMVVATVCLAALAALLVLYFSGDWLLLTVFVVFLVGLGWTAKSTVPRTFEQTKMLLNLGPVRKGERLTFEGVPWEVGTIGIYTELRNTELTGGLIRMSIKRLSTLRSRPHDPAEAWFPSKTGDWVLSGGNLGKVVMQTPEYVQLVRLGGARETFATPDFLSMAPVNLSKSFRVKVIFGIDYALQGIATGEVVEFFKAQLKLRVVDLLEERDHLNTINVEFHAAAASSLDYAILADFKGSAASRYNKIERGIQRICVDICNEKGWVIPFTQVTIHQAGDQ
ncbi:hypothetical protein [Roseibacillus persicicus]|uniref:hypothetical protein n=1 Tax=Roseibacillus persicicus TaxID=454148 RepID=UPI00280C9ED3|nr:hypothetical protein [Roseibacillus persicicus]MDQ8191099.1 hypothetical protein [Roseibacillus persicicus]